MNILKTPLLIILLLLSSQAFASNRAQKISQLAHDYKDNLTKTKLYGETFRAPITKDGRLACARVTQIILKKAGIPGFRRSLYAVHNIQSRTKSWKKIKSLSDVEAGDVVFWRKSSNKKGNCSSGGGSCHVGIAVGNGQAFNNYGFWYRKPSIGSIKRRAGYTFMYSRRIR